MRQLRPLTTTVNLNDRTARIQVAARARRAAEHILVVDIYSYLREEHPKTHLGFWVFDMPAASRFEVDLDFTSVGDHSVRLRVAGRELAAVAAWTNAAYEWDLVVGIQLVRRRRDNNGVVEAHVITAKITEASAINHHYSHVHHDHGYTPALDAPFLWRLHARQLRALERVFMARFAPGTIVLDAGCGRSLFTEIRPRWPFKVVAADVDLDLIRSRRDAFPDHHWAVGAAAPLAFRSASFDGLFAGELIEHLTDPRQALQEFRRVLRPGSVLVLTTPNRKRLANLVDGSDRPISPDHLSELSYHELNELLRAEGFRVVSHTGLHLELLINWFSPLPKLDRLQRQWNRRWAVPLMEALFTAGRVLPSLAVDLLVVATVPLSEKGAAGSTGSPG